MKGPKFSDMDGFGTDIAGKPSRARGAKRGGAQQQQRPPLGPAEIQELQQQRLKKGECATCGQKTHKINVLTRKRTPLTIEGKCLAGTCLNCNQIMPRGAAGGIGGAPAGAGGVGVPGAPLGVVEISMTRGVIPSDDELSVVSGLTMDHELLRMRSRGLERSVATERPQNYMRHPTLSALTEENENLSYEGEIANIPADILDRRGPARNTSTTDALGSDSRDQGRPKLGGTPKQPSRKNRPVHHISGYDTGSSADDSFGINDHYFSQQDALPDRQLRKDLVGSSNQVMDAKVPESDRNLSGFYDDYDDLRWSTSSAGRNAPDNNVGRAPGQTPRNSSGKKKNQSNAGYTPSTDPVTFDDARARVARRYATGAAIDAVGVNNIDEIGHARDEQFGKAKKPSPKKSTRTLGSFYPPSVRSGLNGISNEDAKVEIEEETPIRGSYSPAEDAALRSMTSAEIREIEDAFEVLEKPSLISWRSGYSASQGGYSKASSLSRSTPDQAKPAAAAAAEDELNQPALDDAPVIVYCLNTYPGNSALHEKAFNALFALATTSRRRCKDEIFVNDGIKSIVDGLWRHMDSPSVQEAGLFALWALSVSDDGGSASADVTRIAQGRAVDAILISMQTHLHHPAIQYAGCGILSCLARASTRNSDIDDGTSSGAMYNIVNAMDMHSTNTAVQEWGLRALCHECESSDGNKLNLVRLGGDGIGDGGEGGLLSVYNAMKRFSDDATIQEIGCRLLHCLSFHHSAAKEMSVTTKPIDRVIQAMALQKRNANAIILCEEGCGALANLSTLVEQNNAPMRRLGVIRSVVNVMMAFPRKETVQVLACRVLANLAMVKESREMVLRSNATKIVYVAMRSFSGSTALQEEACRLLRAVCVDSDSRNSVFDSSGLSNIIRAMTKYPDSIVVQENAAGIFAGMAVDESKQASLVSAGAIDAITNAMTYHPKEVSLQEVCCIGLRNFSTCPGSHDTLMLPDNLNAVIRAMIANSMSEVVQQNACGLIWNLSADLKRDPESVMSSGEVKYVVRAMQNHPESARIQSAACGTLWSLATSSEDIQNAIESEGGIDAIMCAFLMHQYDTAVIDRACGVLSSLSFNRRLAKSIADAGCIGTVIELMHDNLSSSALAQSSCLLLRNLACFDTNYAEEASAACSTIIKALQEHSDDADVIGEACGALSSLAAHSETCRERIVSLHGVAAISRAGQNFHGNSDVEREVEGALLQLE